MASHTSTFRNLGKSVAYSSLDVLTDLAPNTATLFRGAREGVGNVADFIRKNTTKLRQNSLQFDRQAYTKRAKRVMDEAWKDIKKGNLSLGDMADEMEDEWDDYFEDFQNTQNIEDTDETTSNQAYSNPTGSDYRTLKGMADMTEALGSATLKATSYQTQHLSNLMMTQMTMNDRHFRVVESQLDSINKNLGILIQQANHQSTTNQAQMAFFDQMTQWMKKQEKRQVEMDKRARNASRNKTSNFLRNDWFDMSVYKDIVKDNLYGSDLGMLMAMSGMMNPDMLKMIISPRGKVQPQALLLNGLLRMAIPRNSRRALSRGDNQINAMAKTLLTQLGTYRYKANANPVLGLLGSLLGIDPKVSRSINMGSYKRDSMNWNGEAQRALTVIIPKELAEIKAAIKGQGPEYYDYKTGRFVSEKEIGEVIGHELRKAVESPMANLYNRAFTMNADDIRNQKFWSQMNAGTQRRISDIANSAIFSAGGLSDDQLKELNRIFGKSIARKGGTKSDAERMLYLLVEAINQSRGNYGDALTQLERTNPTFAMIGGRMADQRGFISQSALREYFGKSIDADLTAANGGRYSQTGKLIEEMGKTDQMQYDADMKLMRHIQNAIANSPNSKHKLIRELGARVNTYIDKRKRGVPTSAWDRILSSEIEDLYSYLNRVGIMGGEGYDDTTEYRFRENRAIQNGVTGNQRRRQSRRRSGVNAAYANATEGVDAEAATAEATEHTAEVVEDALGKKGFLTKFFSLKAGQRIGESRVAQTAREYTRDLFTGEGGVNEHLKSGADRIMSAVFGVNPETGEVDNPQAPIVETMDDVSETIRETAAGATGSSSPEEARRSAPDRARKIGKSIGEFFRKKAPKHIAAAIAGASLPLLSGGKMGLLFGMFAPGGPIGGAIVGAGLSILSGTEGFKRAMFGEKDEETGERSGGLISKELREKFKKSLPLLGKGAAAGIAIRYLGAATGLNTTILGKIGALSGTLLPGGPLGAAVMGSAAALIVNNDKFQEVLFGKKDESGKRTGTFLSNAYNKMTEKIKGMSTDGKPNLLAKFKRLGIGAVAGLGAGHLGILGSAFGLGGPMGTAIMGASLGLLSTTDKVNTWLFGKKDPTNDRSKDKVGIFGKLGKKIELELFEPASAWFKSTSEQFGWWMREKMEVPFRLAFGPLVDSIRDVGDSAKKSIGDTIKDLGDRVFGTVKKFFEPAGKLLMGFLKGGLKATGGLLKGGLFAAGSLLASPFQVLSLLMSPVRRKQEKRFGSFLKENRGRLLKGRWAGQEAEGESTNKVFDNILYTMATLPGIGSLFRNNDLMDEMESMYGFANEGDVNAFNWRSARRDRRQYRKNRRQAAREGRQAQKLIRLRSQWAKADQYNQYGASAEEMQRRMKQLRRMGVTGVDTEEQLRNFTYNYDQWKNGSGMSGAAQTPQEVVQNEQLNELRTQTEYLRDIAEGQDHQVKAEERKAKAAERAAAHARVTGNESGAAHDIVDEVLGGTAPQGDIGGGTGEEKKSWWSKLLGLGGGLLSGISGWLPTLLGGGAIAAILANSDAREWLFGTLKTMLFGRESGVDTGGIVGTAQALGSKLLGTQTSGGLWGRRALSRDENGNVTDTVANTDLTHHLVNTGLTLARGGAGAKTIRAAASMIPGAKLVSVTASGGASLIKKAFSLLSKAFETAVASKMAKRAGVPLTKFLAETSDDIIKAGVKATWVGKLTAALGEAGAKIASYAVPAVNIISAVVIAGDTIQGLIYPEKLFNIDRAYIDTKMSIIGGIFGAVCSATGMGCVLAVISDIVAEVTGFNLLQKIAVTLYKAIGNDQDDANIDQAVRLMEKEVELYNQANGTNLSTKAYNDLKNKGVWGGLWNGAKNIFGAGDTTNYEAFAEAAAESEGLSYTTRAEKRTETLMNSHRATGRSRRGRGASVGLGAGIGFGIPGGQDDPRWANMPIGRFNNGKTATMKLGGCGPTALAYAGNVLGLGMNPAAVGQFAASHGFISDGGANAGLFDRGAGAFGMKSSRLGSGSAVQQALRAGIPVVMSGNSIGHGNPWTSAGHIVTATGLDSSGNVIVHDPMRGYGKYSLGELTPGMTNAWAIGRGPIGYGLIDGLSDKFGNIVTAASATLWAQAQSNQEQFKGKTVGQVIDMYKATLATSASSTEPGAMGNVVNTTGGASLLGANPLGFISARYESTGNPATVSGGLGDPGGVSFGSYQFATFGNTYVKSNSPLYRFWNQYYASAHPGVKPGSNQAFINAWKAEANANPAQFQANEHAFMLENYYKPYWSHMKSRGFDANRHSRAAQEILWSTAIQYGAGTKVLDKAFAGMNPQSMSVAAFVKRAMDYKRDTVGTDYYKKASESVKRGVRSRFDVGERQALNELGNQGPLSLGFGIGYGPIEDIFGGYINKIVGNAASVFGGNTEDTSMIDSLGAPSGNASADQQKVVNQMRSVYGKLFYSRDGNRQDPDKGAASCASTVGWAYRKALGVNGMSASSTTQAKNPNFTTIWTNNGGNSLPVESLQPGDILYQNWDRTSNNGDMQHTEMYAGNGQDLSHGGNPVYGPVLKDLNDYRRKHTMMVRRYNGFINNVGSGIGYGAGPGCRNISDWSFGYGPGDSNGSVVYSARGTETRLDTIISILRQLASQPAPKATTAATSNNSYYGGDTENKVVVVNAGGQSETKQIGRNDVRNERLRAKHNQIAMARHF